jgi:energy-coupling factor transporter ATP-binding protein EcfA2
MSRRSASAAAWLASIELENVRCFRDRQVVPFTTAGGEKAQWTLLLGENGTGKSTLLQICAMLMPRRWEPDTEGAFRARSLMSEEHQADWSWPRRASSSHEVVTRVALSLRKGEWGARWPWKIETDGGAWSTGAEELFPAFKSPPPVPLCLSYAPYRSPWAFLPEDTSPNRARGLFIGFTKLRHPGLWFKDRTFAAVNPDSNEESRKNATVVLERVRTTLLRLLPDISDLRIDTELEGRGANRLRAHTPYGWVDIDSLGMGYQSVLALIVDIASRLVEHYPDSPRPLEEAAVVLIDEVDLHLHPTWQRTLQQQLSSHFPSVQFIATAHSPLVVQSAPEANILLLRREDAHVARRAANPDRGAAGRRVTLGDGGHGADPEGRERAVRELLGST